MYEEIMDLIEQQIGKENIDQINQTYTLLTNYIQTMESSSLEKDVTISGTTTTYQITNSENQKHSDHKVNVSIINLGECEKIIKRKISYENDPTPLLILKIDVQKKQSKTTAVEYEVYNPYTKEKINLTICENSTIGIYAPVNLNSEESSLYDNLNSQGYDLYDVNNSFYSDPCAPYTSSNGTDVSLADRKNYFYDEENVLCEDNCIYKNVNTATLKVFCECQTKTGVDTSSNQKFTPKKLIEKFRFTALANFEVLFCYKLLFSSKGLKNNICFYIMLVLFILFFFSMLFNLFTALKKIDEIIFKIFQDRFFNDFMGDITKKGTKISNFKSCNDFGFGKDINKNEGIHKKTKLDTTKFKNQKCLIDSTGMDSSSILNNKNNLYHMNNKEMKNPKSYKTKHRKKMGKKKRMPMIDKFSPPKSINSNNNSLILKKSSKKSFHVSKEENPHINNINNEHKDIMNHKDIENQEFQGKKKKKLVI